MEGIPDIRVEQAAQLLGRGVKQAEVADRTGISPSYLSEMLSSNIAFQKMVQANIDKNPISAKIDNMLDRLELMNLENIHNNITAFAKPHLALGLARTLNAAKRRSEGEAKPAQDVNVTVVNLELPDFIATQFEHADIKKNAQNEVVEVNGSPLITASAAGLIEQAQKSLDDGKVETLEIIADAPSLPDPDFQPLKFTKDEKEIAAEKFDEGVEMLQELGDNFEL